MTGSDPVLPTIPESGTPVVDSSKDFAPSTPFVIKAPLSAREAELAAAYTSTPSLALIDKKDVELEGKTDLQKAWHHFVSFLFALPLIGIVSMSLCERF
jgi:hypothetical protein